MKNIMAKKILFLGIFSLMISGCALGPLVSHESAQTVGDSKHEFVGGIGQAGYVIKWNYGVTDDFDVGLHWESLSIGVRGKYAFLNQTQGLSLATALGVGSSIGGDHYYVDLMASHKNGSFEPYSTLRLVHVKTDPIELQNEDTGEVDFSIDSYEYQYGQLFLGSRFWLSEKWILSLEASSLFTLSSGLSIGSNFLFGGALGYRF